MVYRIPEDNYYTKEHEWAQVDENIVTVGITEFAQNQLGEIVYVELPEEGQKVTQNQPFGVVESVKAVSDLYSPVSGTVIEVNNTLVDDPAPLNDDPMNDGWLIRIEMDTEKELAQLMRAGDYKKLIAEK
ncbi:MAG: glycine cleavage system protein H [Bdellovibrio sp. 28-41-41]|jgi:glycine cleavage system H protein|nr:MAG: glycine cleavage system protein H [Bdellovibrio sp. 28-41-41]|tara:strand:- start:248 stop:637 length:390 start_codon:yes stop_codon:yes gene_type:complete